MEPAAECTSMLWASLLLCRECTGLARALLCEIIIETSIETIAETCVETIIETATETLLETQHET